MSDPFVAEIRIFGFNFAPRGWALCNGQLMPISQNTALFSLLGTTYGGDGQSNFALPNLQDSAPMHPGQGLGLSLHDLGETGGEEAVTLIDSEQAAHPHTLMAQAGASNQNDPTGKYFGTVFGGGALYRPPAGAAPTTMAAQAVAPTGGSLPHNNLMPFQTLNFCIALQGIFPPRG